MDLELTPLDAKLLSKKYGAKTDHLLDKNQHAYHRGAGAGLNLRQQTGLLHLLRLNPSIIYFPLIGFTISTIAFGFSYWFSLQTFSCPTWATDCNEGGRIASSFVANYGTVQGFVTTIHGIGLAIIVTSTYCLGLVATWPIFSKRPYKFSTLDIYIPAARGSFSSLAKAFWYFRSNRGGLIILPLVTLTAIIVQLDSTLAGHVYNRQNVTHEYHGKHTMGGGIGLTFDQRNPPGPLPVAVGGALSLYTSWSENYSNEPLPELRDFWLNRADFVDIGSFSAIAVKIQKDINCHGFALNISGQSIIDNQTEKVGKYTLSINTNMASGPVLVRIQPVMATWVDNIKYISKYRTISTLVFAAFNGTIESGTSIIPLINPFPPPQKDGSHYTNEISAVVCDVDVSLIDSQLTNGAPKKNLPISKVSALTDVQGHSPPVSEYGPTGDVAAWLAVAATTFGTSVYAPKNLELEDRELGEIHQRLFGRASDVYISRAANPGGFTARSITVFSNTDILQLEKSRIYLRLVPQLLLLLLIAVMALVNVLLYRQARIPVMYQASVSELVMFTQSDEIAKAARASTAEDKTESTLAALQVKFSTGKGGLSSLGLESVKSLYSK